jgi:hypothetical protein
MNRIRAWATPFVASAGLSTAITGVMMFFHARGGLTEPIHEWSGLLLVAGVALHLVANWKALCIALKSPWAITVAAVFGVATVAAILPLGGDAGRHQGGPPHARATEALLDAPLSTVASVVRRTPDELLTDLAGQGLRVPESGRSLRAIAAENGRGPHELLAIVLRGEDSGRPRGAGPRRRSLRAAP